MYFYNVFRSLGSVYFHPPAKNVLSPVDDTRRQMPEGRAFLVRLRKVLVVNEFGIVTVYSNQTLRPLQKTLLHRVHFWKSPSNSVGIIFMFCTNMLAPAVKRIILA